MSYYRLRDIKTPPFAYILNRDDVVKTCQACHLPFQEPAAPLCVEICVNGPGSWPQRLAGQPLMADHWLIGDEAFGEKLCALLDCDVPKLEVDIYAWLTQEPSWSRPNRPHPSSSNAPQYYHFFPAHHLELTAEVAEQFPPFWCNGCKRHIPNIPFDFQPTPKGNQHYPFAALKHFHLDGFDYLFHESVVNELRTHFPNMLFEQLT